MKKTVKKNKRGNVEKVVSANEFVTAWQTSKYFGEVVEKTGMDREHLYQRAHYYRSVGVPLKLFRNRMQPGEKLKLRDLAISLVAKGGE